MFAGKPWLSGAAHVAFTPIAWLLLAALLLGIAGLQGGWLLAGTGLVAAASALGLATTAVPPLAGPVLALLLAGVGLVGRRLPGALALVLVAAVGLAAGSAVDLDAPVRVPAVLGATLVFYLVVALFLAGWQDLERSRLAPALPLARRILSAWIAAIALLLLALAARQASQPPSKPAVPGAPAQRTAPAR